MPRKNGKKPPDWPGVGEPPSFGYKHVAPYTLDTALWLSESMEWIDGIGIDRRRVLSCRKVIHAIVAHIEANDSLPDGSPFACLTKQSLAKELGVRRETVRSAIDTLTMEGGPLVVVYKSGTRMGECYKFVPPDVTTNSREIIVTSDVTTNSREIIVTSDVTTNSPDVTNNSPKVTTNSPDVTNNSPKVTNNSGDSGHSISIPISIKDRDRDKGLIDARAVEGPRGIIDTSSVMSMEQIRQNNAANEAASPARGRY